MIFFFDQMTHSLLKAPRVHWRNMRMPHQLAMLVLVGKAAKLPSFRQFVNSSCILIILLNSSSLKFGSDQSNHMNCSDTQSSQYIMIAVRSKNGQNDSGKLTEVCSVSVGVAFSHHLGRAPEVLHKPDHRTGSAETCRQRSADRLRSEIPSQISS